MALTTALKEEIEFLVENLIIDGKKINKYDVLTTARKNLGEFVRYRDVRDDIEDIIYETADRERVDLNVSYEESNDGRTFKVYTIVDDLDDDSDLLDDNDSDDSDDSDDSNDSDNIEVKVKLDSRNRVTIPVNMVQAAGFIPEDMVGVFIDSSEEARLRIYTEDELDNFSVTDPIFDNVVNMVTVESNGVIRFAVPKFVRDKSIDNSVYILLKNGKLFIKTI